MNEASGRVEDDAFEQQPQPETGALVDWLTGHLRVSRAPEAQATSVVLPPPLAAPQVPEAAVEAPHVEEPEPPAAEEHALVAAEAPLDDELALEPPPPAEQPTTLAPQVLPADVDGDEDPAAAFLAREQRARRNQRAALAAAALVLLLLALYVGARLRPHEPAPGEPSVAAAPAAAVPEVPAPVAPPAPAEEPTPLEEEAPPAANAGAPRVWAGFGAPAAAAAPASDPLLGPSVARFPDLPRDVLIQLEKAATPEP